MQNIRSTTCAESVRLADVGMEICDGAPMRTAAGRRRLLLWGTGSVGVDRSDVVSVGQQADRGHALSESLAPTALASGIKALHC